MATEEPQRANKVLIVCLQDKRNLMTFNDIDVIAPVVTAIVSYPWNTMIGSSLLIGWPNWFKFVTHLCVVLQSNVQLRTWFAQKI